MMDNNLRLIRLTEDYEIKNFDCGNSDLNDFLFSEAKSYLKRLLSVTYLIEDENNTVAYFSVSNDKVSVLESEKTTWRRIKKTFPHKKHRHDYPAVKIGRLGVSKEYQHTHIGSDILYFIEKMFITNNRTGCSFITVDALKEAIPFYLKNGFSYLSPSKNEKNSATHLLYFNLQSLL